MKIIPCDGPFGIEIHDLDAQTMSEEELQICRQHQAEHGVIFFRQQNLSCEDHIALAERFGMIVINRFFECLDSHPEIAVVRKEPQHDSVVGECWHTDHSYDAEPAYGSILCARQLPTSGGDTQFVNMHLVFESLSEGLKQTLQTLSANHSSRHTFSAVATEGDERFHSPELATQDNIHPVVIRHPFSSRKVLYVNGDFTTHLVGWRKEESEALLEYLYSVAQQPKNILTFKWQPGTVAFWDNRMTWHRALNDYPGQTRLMHRITLEGCALQAAAQ